MIFVTKVEIFLKKAIFFIALMTPEGIMTAVTAMTKDLLNMKEDLIPAIVIKIL